MGQILLPKQYHPDFALPGKKPIGPVEVDWNNPLTKGLAVCYVPRLTTDPVDIKGSRITAVDVVPTSRITKGVVVAEHGLSDGSAPVDETGIFFEGSTGGLSNAVTLVVKSRPNNTDDAGDYWTAVFGTFFSSKPAVGNIGITYRSGTAAEGTPNPAQQRFTIQGVADYASTLKNLNGTAFQLHGVSAVSGGTVTYYTDGLPHQSHNIGSFTGSDDGWTLGDRQSGGVALYSNVELAYVFHRALSDTEWLSLELDPYQILKPATPQIYTFPSVAGTVDNLLADNLQSLSEIGTATIAQVHALLADDLQSLSEIATVAIGQVHTLLADDLQSLSQLSTPTVLTGDILLADDLQSLSEVATVTIGQTHVLLADDLQSVSEVATVAVGQVHVLLADDLQSLSQLSTPALASGDILLADDLQSVSEVSTATLAQVHVLLADDLQSLSTVSTASIIKGITIDGNDTKVIATNFQSTTLYFNEADYFTIT